MAKSNNEYDGFFAEFYDILQGPADEVPAYINFIKKYKEPILEIGCGTGRLLVPLVQEGYQITGIDLSEDMLAICREKLEERELEEKANLVQADMRHFQLNSKFNIIFTACNTIFHLETADDLEKFFKRVKDHLTEEGIFIIDISAPDIRSMLDSNGEEFVSEYKHPTRDTKIVNHFSPTYDILNQRERDKIILKEFDGKELIREAKTEVTLTFFWPRELRIMLEKCGFEILEEYGSLQGDPLISGSKEIIFLAGLK